MCPVCRRSGGEKVITALLEEDKGGYFYAPVTEEVAPGYFNVIARPCSLSEVAARCARGAYDTQGTAGCGEWEVQLR